MHHSDVRRQRPRRGQSVVHNGQVLVAAIGNGRRNIGTHPRIAGQNQRALAIATAHLHVGFQRGQRLRVEPHPALAADAGAVAGRFQWSAGLASRREQRAARLHIRDERPGKEANLHAGTHDGLSFTARVMAVMLAKVVDVDSPQAGAMMSTPSRTSSTARSAILSGAPH